MPEDGFEHALAMLAAGKRWQQGGVDHRQGEYVCGGEEVWREGDGYLHRSWTAHGWGGDPPDDVHENTERWDEAELRARLGAALSTHHWDHAPSGPPIVPSVFDPLLAMPGAVQSALAVSSEDLDRVVGLLRRGYTFDRSGTEQRGTMVVWGREQIRHPLPAESAHFYRTRSWASGRGDDVCVRIDTWDEAELRAVLQSRPDIVHWDRWPPD